MEPNFRFCSIHCNLNNNYSVILFCLTSYKLIFQTKDFIEAGRGGEYVLLLFPSSSIKILPTQVLRLGIISLLGFHGNTHLLIQMDISIWNITAIIRFCGSCKYSSLEIGMHVDGLWEIISLRLFGAILRWAIFFFSFLLYSYFVTRFYHCFFSK